jgi:hypothetical protein
VGGEGAKSQLVAARYDGSLSWYAVGANDDKLTEKPVHEVAQAHRGWIRDLVAFDGGRRLASVGDDMLVKVWDAKSGKLIAELAGHPLLTPQDYVSSLYAVAATPDGKHLASGDRVGELRFWDVEKRRETGRVQCPGFYTFDPEKRDRSIGGVRRLAFSPDGRLLAAAGIGQISNVDGFVGPCRVEVWDWRAGKRVAALEDDHKAVLNDLAWTVDGKRIAASGGGDAGGVLLAWSLGDTGGEEVKPLVKAKFTGHTHRLAWLDDAGRLIAAGFESVQLWDLSELG